MESKREREREREREENYRAGRPRCIALRFRLNCFNPSPRKSKWRTGRGMQPPSNSAETNDYYRLSGSLSDFQLDPDSSGARRGAFQGPISIFRRGNVFRRNEHSQLHLRHGSRRKFTIARNRARSSRRSCRFPLLSASLCETRRGHREDVATLAAGRIILSWQDEILMSE